MASDRLRRSIQREARGLIPSVELPWSPPFEASLGSELVDAIADVLVVQADVADDRMWSDDVRGRRSRHRTAESAIALHDRCVALDLRATAAALRSIAASLRAWEAIPRA